MTQRNAAFRVDASYEVGTGHLMRCLTLADALCQRGWACVFISRDHAGNNLPLIAKRGHRLLTLPSLPTASEIGLGQSDTTLAHASWLGCTWEQDAADTIAVLLGAWVDTLVVDHYALDWRWEREVQNVADKIIVIDDLADRVHDCDILLDQNLGRTPADYSQMVPATCRLLIGPGYALLRPEFAQLRTTSLQRSRHPVRRVLVSLGGMDKDNVTCRVIEAVNTLPTTLDVHLTVVMGSHSPVLKQVCASAAASTVDTKVVVGATNMAELMTAADLAIGASGATTWERCCMGLPTVTIMAADNQRDVAEALASINATAVLDKNCSISQLSMTIASLMGDQTALASMSRTVSLLVDGLGTERVADAVLRSAES